MTEKVVSPEVCVFNDENLETMNIQYMASYSLIFPVEPKKAIANYANGLLTVNVPYKKPFAPGVKVKID